MRSLEDSGYQMVDHFLTAGALEAANKAFRTCVANVPRRAVSILHQNLAARVDGGFSLMVLAT